jgi:hypothetical protein
MFFTEASGMGTIKFFENYDESYRMTHSFAQNMVGYWKNWKLTWHRPSSFPVKE